MNDDVVGDGDVRVLVLHGWAVDAAMWRRATPFLDTARFRYALADFPGYGRLGHEPPADGMDGMVEAAFAAADRLGWSRFSVLGHSMGGTAALGMACRGPERVQAVCALTPVGAAGMAFEPELYAKLEAAWPQIGWIVRFVSPHLDDATVEELERASAEGVSREAWVRYLANWTGAGLMGELDAVRAPVTVVVGEHDPLVTEDHLASTLAALPRRPQLVRLAAAAHFPMVERPRACVAAWEAALGAVPAPLAT